MNVTEMQEASKNTYQTRQDAINQLTSELCKQVVDILDHNLRSCMNCENFRENTETCMKYAMRPPAKIIAKACPDWLYSAVPF